MSGALNGPLLALVVFCVLAEAAREVCFKLASGTGGMRMFVHPAAFAGFVFWGTELVAWTYVLTRLPLSLAFPLMASSYMVIAIAGALIFKETLTFRHRVGVALITAGVLCIGLMGK
ncbi:EamA family transporter [Rhizobium wuzhouense]|uniref:Permease n=1 Tax=Rhizobium wuzhouense TaxID=1986026 RepID=A0ABX5NSB3_9HYPH|nr:EamA family transporter [Rhizobium wuzhouense]PYB74216.1 permease [Rhizobium wuzhouense]